MAKPHAAREAGKIRSAPPESAHELFERFVNEGDLDRIARLYEPDAALVDRDGSIVSGNASIAKYMRGLLSLRPKMQIRPLRTIEAGDVAVLLSEWEMQGTAPDGSAISGGGHTYDIVRRRPDGTWKIVVDNPWGTLDSAGAKGTRQPRTE